MSETTASPELSPASVPAAPAIAAEPAGAAAVLTVPEPVSTGAPTVVAIKSVKSRRVGVVPFLNAQPLMWGLKENYGISLVAPNEMGKALKEGTLDVALAPIAASFLNPDLKIIPVAAIACQGPVQSVRIVSHVALERVERLFVDSRSQTSVLLARLILQKWFGVKNLEVKPIDAHSFHPNQAKPWEDTLQFGDGALIPAPSGMTVTDLGAEWFRYTQKPFVFAVWLARDAEIAKEMEEPLRAARIEGVKHCEEIANQYHGIWQFKRTLAKEYLEKNIFYDYTPEQEKGIAEFLNLLKEQKLI